MTTLLSQLTAILLILGIFHMIRDLLQELNSKSFVATWFTKRKSKVPGWYWKIFRSGIWITLTVIFAIVAIYLNQPYPFTFLSLISYLIFELAWFYYWFKY